MDKYIEIKRGKQVDRYHLNGISVNEFIDAIIIPQGKNAKQIIDISKDDFETHHNSKWYIDFNVEDKFEVRHYVKEHKNEKSETAWKNFLSTLK